jgi:hypothetical protein
MLAGDERDKKTSKYFLDRFCRIPRYFYVFCINIEKSHLTAEKQISMKPLAVF